MTEHVVLVDQDNNVLGTMPKSEVHTKETPLHRGFSAFIFKGKDLLLQQRSHEKKTWPLVWSNSLCGHPALNESNADAVKRRLKDELGLHVEHIEEASLYRYKFTRDGVMENEICPILIGKTDKDPNLNPKEVEAVRWVPWEEFVKETEEHPERYSEWCIEEVAILKENEKLKKLLEE
ncbi:isopentenyl-diphosphate delta-isomerase [bacterium]|mgnify:CR=1 FL=1|nr:isopentenyl-diphosphate delta-isomerase [bacterium]|tara:strand:+ start:11353 stop:11886 length:534 start_codon:yes stop_codon:yes gene_type:complete